MDLLPPVCDSAEMRLLRRSVQGMLLNRLDDSTTLDLDATGTFDRQTWRALGAAGLLGLGVEPEGGGSGGSIAESFLVTAEIARRLPSLAVDYVLCAMTARMLADHGTAGQRGWLASMNTGDAICAYALTEPGGGTDLLQLTTRAELSASGWVVTGRKQWISLAADAELMFVLARTDPPPDGRSRAHGLSLLAVPRQQPGVETHRIRLESMRAAGSYDVTFDGALSHDDGLIGERGRGFFILRDTLDIERILSAAISLGIAAAALEMTVDHMVSRHAFGGPIGRFQSLQHGVADSLTELTAAATLTERAIYAVVAAALDASRLSAMAKLAASEAAARVVDRGMRAWGAMGLASEARMQMMFRDSRLALFSPVSNEMVRNTLAESIGLPRSY